MMINWFLNLDNFDKQIKQLFFDNLKNYLIKEDLNYLDLIINESDCDDCDLINTYFFWSKFSIWSQKRKFNFQLDQLACELKKTKSLFRKCLFCEYQFEVLQTNWPNELLNLKKSRYKLYKDLCKFFKKIRDNCYLIYELNDEIDKKLFSDNQISKLPINSYDEILEVDDFNHIKLKSLVSLIKLEISELLTIIIFNYSIDKSNIYVKLINLSSFINNLIDQFKQFNNELNEDCFYLTNYFTKNKEDKPTKTKIDTNQNEIIFNLRSSKTKIYSSLIMIDNYLDSILDDNQSKQLDCDKIIEELKNAISNLELVSKKSKQKAVKLISEKFDKFDSTLDNLNDLNKKEVSLNENIPEYEVFEAYIEEDEKLERFLREYDEDNMFRNAKFPETLYSELKKALNTKAKDHRSREAKALGVDESLIEPIDKKVEIRINYKEKYSNLSTDPLPKSPFSLINFKGDKSMKLNFLTNEENFGDNLSSSDSEESSKDELSYAEYD